jgi:hypothetical protein
VRRVTERDSARFCFVMMVNEAAHPKGHYIHPCYIMAL